MIAVLLRQLFHLSSFMKKSLTPSCIAPGNTVAWRSLVDLNEAIDSNGKNPRPATPRVEQF